MTPDEDCEKLGDEEMSRRKSAFDQEMEKRYNERKAAPYRYYATTLRRMYVNRDGDWVRTVKDILWGPGETSEGLNRLCREGRLHLSVQAVVLQSEDRCLFTEKDRQQAHDTLCSYEYRAEGDTFPCRYARCKCARK